MSDTLIRTEAHLDDEQRGLLAWTLTVTGDEGLDRIRDHIKLVASSLRIAIRREEAARTLLQAWLANFGSTGSEAEAIGPCLNRDTKRWLE